MTTWAWVLFGCFLVMFLMSAWLLYACVRLAAAVNQWEARFQEAELEHIREIQELVNQYPPPKGDLAP